MKALQHISLFILATLFCGSNIYGNRPAPRGDKDFASFLARFTSSASFQYSRVKFPLKSPIKLMSDDGTSEKSFAFTREKWPLLSYESLSVRNKETEGEGIYISRFAVNKPTHKIFQAGYEDSELDLKVTFDLIGGKWYVTDCYTGWYSFELSATELKEAIRQVQRENLTFIRIHP